MTPRADGPGVVETGIIEQEAEFGEGRGGEGMCVMSSTPSLPVVLV